MQFSYPIGYPICPFHIQLDIELYSQLDIKLTDWIRKLHFCTSVRRPGHSNVLIVLHNYSSALPLVGLFANGLIAYHERKGLHAFRHSGSLRIEVGLMD